MIRHFNLILIAILISTVSVTTVYAQESLLPGWIKTIAGFWSDNQISDEEFVGALQYLVKEGILVIPSEQTQIDPLSLELDKELSNRPKYEIISDLNNDPDTFSDISCESMARPDYIEFTGQFNNGNTGFTTIVLNVSLLNDEGSAVTVDVDYIKNVAPFDSRLFNTVIIYSGSWDSCEVEINDVYRSEFD